MKKLQTLFLALLISAAVSAQSWTVDKAHAKLGFGVTHLLLSEVTGIFSSFDAKITSSKDDFSDAVIELTADVKSINTNNEMRDKDLRSDKYFDAEKFSTLTFKSKSFTKGEGKNYTLIGDLTIHGVTKPVTLNVILNGVAVHPFNKKTMAGFKITGTLQRKDFHVGDGTPGAIVSEEVSLTANAEFFKD